MTSDNKTNNSHGDWQSWDRVWKNGLAAEDEILYRPDTPRTLRQLWQRCYFEDLWALLGPRAHTRTFLELGSGRATTSMYLAAHGAQSITLVDLAPHALELAKRNFARCNLREPRTVLADAASTGLPDASFDCIYKIGLLEHYEDPAPVLRETWRLLAPDGLIFMVIVPRVPFTRSLAMRFRLQPLKAMIFCAKGIAKLSLRRHRQASTGFTRTELPPGEYLRIMSALGCTDAQCIPYNPFHPLDSSLHSEIAKTVAFCWEHYVRTVSSGTRPALRTARWSALCDLLLCRKVTPTK